MVDAKKKKATLWKTVQIQNGISASSLFLILQNVWIEKNTTHKKKKKKR